MAYAHDRTLLASLGFADPDKKDPLHDLACQYIAQPSVLDTILKKSSSRYVFNTSSTAKFEHPVTKGVNQYKTTIGFLDVVLPVRYQYEGFETRPTGKRYQFATEAEAKAACVYLEHHTEPLWIGGVSNYVIEDAERRIRNLREEIEKLESKLITVDGGLFGSFVVVDNSKKIALEVEIKKATAILEKGSFSSYYVVFECEKVSVGNLWSETNHIFVEVKIKPVGLGEILRQINLYREYVGGWCWFLATAFEMSTALVDGLRAHDIYPIYLGEGFQKYAAQQRVVANVVSF